MRKHVRRARFDAPSWLAPAAAEPQTVTVRLVRSLGQAAYYAAVAKGHFEQEGIARGSTTIAHSTRGPKGLSCCQGNLANVRAPAP